MEADADRAMASVAEARRRGNLGDGDAVTDMNEARQYLGNKGRQNEK